MSKRGRFWAFLWVAALVLAGALVLSAARPQPNVQLRASFRGLTDPAFPGDPAFYVDKVLNDAQGPYVTGDNGNVSVWITSDVGDLFFEIQHHSGRSALVVFPDLDTPCGYLPDTAGIYPLLPDVPLDFLRIRTYNNSSFLGPKLNFLKMSAGVPKQVRFWFLMCTADVHNILLDYNNSDPGAQSGFVEVTAFDVNGDGTLDRWEISPVSGTNDMVWIKQNPESRGLNREPCFFGGFPMPFKLVLERL